MKKILVSGSNGLIGGEVVSYFSNKGMDVFGIDNNMRADFFGPAGDTTWNQNRLQKMYNNYMPNRSEEHTSELQSQAYLGCRLLLEKKNTKQTKKKTKTTPPR